MSEFAVIATALNEHAERLRGLSGEIETARGQVAQGAGVGADTPAAGAVEDLTGHIQSGLAEFGAVTDALMSVVSGAGVAYALADLRVTESAS